MLSGVTSTYNSFIKPKPFQTIAKREEGRESVLPPPTSSRKVMGNSSRSSNAIALLVWYFCIVKIRLSGVKREVVYMLTDEEKDNSYLRSALTAVLLNKTQWCHYSFKAHRENCIF